MIQLLPNFIDQTVVDKLNHQARNIIHDDYAECFIRNRIPDMPVPGSFRDQISELVLSHNTVDYQFDLGDAVNVERFLFAEYTQGHRCELHQDIYTTMFFEDQVRKLSVITCLENSAQGGDLVFYYTKNKEQLGLASLTEQAQERYTLNAGDVIIFPSHLYHEITDIESGRRRTLLALITGPRFK